MCLTADKELFLEYKTEATPLLRIVQWFPTVYTVNNLAPIYLPSEIDLFLGGGYCPKRKTVHSLLIGICGVEEEGFVGGGRSLAYLGRTEGKMR